MTTPAPSDGGPLGATIAGYLQAIERGERPDRAALLAENPDLADELSAFFADLDRIERMAAPLRLDDPDLTIAPGRAVPGPADVVKYFGDYELEEEIARGGMGVVYRARQKSLNRVVALKMILAGQFAAAADVRRFQIEAEAAANLDHPNILPIYEVGTHEGKQYFTMKLIEGGSLAGRVEALKADPRAAAGLLATLARAVHFAHQRGILHRDLKPANVLLGSDDVPYVTDFGLARKVEGESGLTHTGAVVGTPSYMPPEQARGEKGLTVAADVYSLGAILYELLTGVPPFRGATVFDTVMLVMDKDPHDVRAINPKADRNLGEIARKCLAKQPADRYASAAELADDLSRWLAGEPIKARPPSLPALALAWLRRNAAAAATVVAVGVVWGVLTGMLPFVADTDSHVAFRPIRLLAQGEGWFNPIGWAYRMREVPVVRWAVIVGAAVLWLAAGWVLRVGTRPRTPAAAIGVAAAAGLLAAWVSNLFVAPMLASGTRDQLYVLRAEDPPTWRFDPDTRRFRITVPDFDSEHPDLKTLEQYVAPERRDTTRMENATEYARAHRDLMWVNRHHRTTLAVWMSQFVTLLLFLIGALTGGGAVDYLARSGRSLAARVACYVELYGTTMIVLPAAALFAVFLRVAAEGAHHQNPPPVTPFAVLFVGALVAAAAAWVGVVRRWHPAWRVGLYAVVAGVVVAAFALAT